MIPRSRRILLLIEGWQREKKMIREVYRVMSKRTTRYILLFITFLAAVLLAINGFLGLQERHTVQKRARQFLAEPIPDILKASVVSVHGSPDEALSVSRSLILQAERGCVDGKKSSGALAIAYAEVASCRMAVPIWMNAKECSMPLRQCCNSISFSSGQTEDYNVVLGNGMS
jgi:hypothetical protein